MARYEIRERSFAGGDDRFDGVDLGNCGQCSCTWTDQIANLRGRDGGNAINGRRNSGVAKVQLRLFNGGFVSLNIGPARSGSSDRRISFLVADNLLIK